MRRVLVIGRGVFGSAASASLRTLGIEPLRAARTPPCDVLLDAEDARSLLAGLQRGDVVIDAAGPFTSRTTTLVRCAIERACDVVDLNESLDHALAVRALSQPVEEAGIRVLSSCSAVSALSHALISLSGLEPVAASVLLVPAAGETASPAIVQTLVHSLDRPVRLLRKSSLTPAEPSRHARRFRLPQPLGSRRGWLLESADAVLLPESWPTLTDIDFWVDPGPAPDWPPIRRLTTHLPPRLLCAVARRLGRTTGAYAVETRDHAGATVTTTFWGSAATHRMAVIPATLAAHALASGAPVPAGIAPAHHHLPRQTLLDHLARAGIEYASLTSPR